MKKFYVICAAVICSITVGIAQSNESDKVAEAVEQLRKAMIDGDQKILENLSIPELSYGHSSGLVEDQTTFVQSIVSGKNDFQTIELTGQTIKMVGDDMAIVRHNFKGELKLPNGSTANPDIGILMIWKKEKSQWKLLARQAFKR